MLSARSRPLQCSRSTKQLDLDLYAFKAGQLDVELKREVIDHTIVCKYQTLTPWWLTPLYSEKAMTALGKVASSVKHITCFHICMCALLCASEPLR